MLDQVPYTRTERIAWLRAVARDEELTFVCARLMGLEFVALDVPFKCVLHDSCSAMLTRGRNGEIVYYDETLAVLQRKFQTLPELRAALASGRVVRLKGLQLALWRLRLLHDGGLITFASAPVPYVATTSEAIVLARDGFDLLLRCRWWLDPGEAVSFSRRFAEAWCGLPAGAGRDVINALLKLGVLRKVGELPSGFRNPTNLYLPCHA